MRAVRVDLLPHQARLADARLADEGHDLAVTRRRTAECLPQLLELGVPADELGEPAVGTRGQAGAARPGADQLVRLHRRVESLHRHRAKRPHLDVALGQRQRLGRDGDRAGIGELLHARGQVRRLADSGVVHVQIAADGAHHDLPGVEPDADLDDGGV